MGWLANREVIELMNDRQKEIEMHRHDVNIRLGPWHEMQQDALPIRHAVFVIEQGVPPEEEVDEMDAACVHAVAYDVQGQALATGRLLPDGHIGRMAVSASARGNQVGSAVLQALIGEARTRGHVAVVLHAQTHAIAFYNKHGFVLERDEFFEANISHFKMVLGLA